MNINSGGLFKKVSTLIILLVFLGSVAAQSITDYKVSRGALNDIWHRVLPISDTTANAQVVNQASNAVLIDFLASIGTLNTPNVQPTNVQDTEGCCRAVDLQFKVYDSSLTVKPARTISMTPISGAQYQTVLDAGTTTKILGMQYQFVFQRRDQSIQLGEIVTWIAPNSNVNPNVFATTVATNATAPNTINIQPNTPSTSNVGPNGPNEINNIATSVTNAVISTNIRATSQTTIGVIIDTQKSYIGCDVYMRTGTSDTPMIHSLLGNNLPSGIGVLQKFLTTAITPNKFTIPSIAFANNNRVNLFHQTACVINGGQVEISPVSRYTPSGVPNTQTPSGPVNSNVIIGEVYGVADNIVARVVPSTRPITDGSTRGFDIMLWSTQPGTISPITGRQTPQGQPININWAIVHYSINSQPQFHIQMTKNGNILVANDIKVVPGDVITFTFSYEASNVSTTTTSNKFIYTVPTPAQLPILNPDPADPTHGTSLPSEQCMKCFSSCPVSSTNVTTGQVDPVDQCWRNCCPGEDEKRMVALINSLVILNPQLIRGIRPSPEFATTLVGNNATTFSVEKVKKTRVMKAMVLDTLLSSLTNLGGIGTTISGLGNTLSPTIGTIGTTTQDLLDTAEGATTSAVVLISGIFDSTGLEIVGTVLDQSVGIIYDSAGTVLATGVSTIQTTLPQVTGLAGQTVLQITNAIPTVTGLLGTVIDPVTGAIGGLTSLAGSFVQVIESVPIVGGTAGGIFNSGIETFEEIYNSLFGSLGLAPSGMGGASIASTTSNSLSGLGGILSGVTGSLGGITGSLGGITSAATDVAGSLLGTVSGGSSNGLLENFTNTLLSPFNLVLPLLSFGTSQPDTAGKTVKPLSTENGTPEQSQLLGGDLLGGLSGGVGGGLADAAGGVLSGGASGILNVATAPLSVIPNTLSSFPTMVNDLVCINAACYASCLTSMESLVGDVASLTNMGGSSAPPNNAPPAGSAVLGPSAPAAPGSPVPNVQQLPKPPQTTGTVPMTSAAMLPVMATMFGTAGATAMRSATSIGASTNCLQTCYTACEAGQLVNGNGACRGNTTGDMYTCMGAQIDNSFGLIGTLGDFSGRILGNNNGGLLNMLPFKNNKREFKTQQSQIIDAITSAIDPELATIVDSNLVTDTLHSNLAGQIYSSDLITSLSNSLDPAVQAINQGITILPGATSDFGMGVEAGTGLSSIIYNSVANTPVNVVGSTIISPTVDQITNAVPSLTPVFNQFTNFASIVDDLNTEQQQVATVVLGSLVYSTGQTYNSLIPFLAFDQTNLALINQFGSNPPVPIISSLYIQDNTDALTESLQNLGTYASTSSFIAGMGANPATTVLTNLSNLSTFLGGGP